MNQRKDKKGYLRVFLDDNGKTKFVPIHRLVAMAFIPNILNNPQVNHLDGNKENNRVENLEWCTESENLIHAYKYGLKKHSDKAGKAKRAVYKINKETNEIIDEYPSIAEAARQNKISAGNIGACCRNSYGRKSLNGFIWKFKENGGDAE